MFNCKYLEILQLLFDLRPPSCDPLAWCNRKSVPCSEAKRRGRDHEIPSISKPSPTDNQRRLAGGGEVPLSEQRWPDEKTFSCFNDFIAAVTDIFFLASVTLRRFDAGHSPYDFSWGTTEAFCHYSQHLYLDQVSLKVPGSFFLVCESPLSFSFCLHILSSPTLKITMFQLFICYCLLQNIPLVCVQPPGHWLTAGLW